MIRSRGDDVLHAAGCLRVVGIAGLLGADFVSEENTVDDFFGGCVAQSEEAKVHKIHFS